MNSDYKNGIPLFSSQGRAGIDLIQVFVAPTATWKITPSQTISVSVSLAYQRFEVKGLQGFSGFSTSPNDLTNRGHDNSYDAGLHVGWIGEVTNTVTLGATWILANKSELSFAYTHAFENTVNVSNSIPPGFPPNGLGGGEADLKIYQNSLGIDYGWKL